MPSVFDKPVLSQYVSQYIPAPIEEYNVVGNKLEQQYHQNLDATDKLTDFMESIKALPIHDSLKQQIIGEYRGRIDEFAGKGNWEDANPFVRKLARDVKDDAISGNLAGIQSAYQSRQEMLKGLQEAYDKGNVDHQTMQMAPLLSDQLYVQAGGDKDPRKAYTPYSYAQYKDINKAVSEFVKGWKESDSYGNITRTPDGKFWTRDGTRQVSFNEVYNAAAKYVMNDPSYMSYINQKAMFDTHNLSAENEAEYRTSLINSLTSAGYKKEDLEKYSTRDLTRENIIHGYAYPAADREAFSSELVNQGVMPKEGDGDGNKKPWDALFTTYTPENPETPITFNTPTFSVGDDGSVVTKKDGLRTGDVMEALFTAGGHDNIFGWMAGKLFKGSHYLVDWISGKDVTVEAPVKENEKVHYDQMTKIINNARAAEGKPALAGEELNKAVQNYRQVFSSGQEQATFNIPVETFNADEQKGWTDKFFPVNQRDGKILSESSVFKNMKFYDPSSKTGLIDGTAFAEKHITKDSDVRVVGGFDEYNSLGWGAGFQVYVDGKTYYMTSREEDMQNPVSSFMGKSLSANFNNISHTAEYEVGGKDAIFFEDPSNPNVRYLKVKIGDHYSAPLRGEGSDPRDAAHNLYLEYLAEYYPEAYKNYIQSSKNAGRK